MDLSSTQTSNFVMIHTQNTSLIFIKWESESAAVNAYQ